MLRRYLWLPVSLLLLGFVVWHTRPWEIAQLGIAFDPVPLLAAVALNGVVVLLWAIRSRSLMAGVGYPLSIGALIPVVSFANTVSNLTPASAGEALRAVVLRNRHGVPLTRSTAVILVERLWAVGIMAVSAAAAAFVILGHAAPAVAAAVWLAAAVACFAPALADRAGIRPGRLLERRRSRGGRVTAPAGRGARMVTALIELDRTLETLVTDPRRAVVFVATTAGIFACYAAQLSLVLGVLGEPLPLDASWAALGLATVAGVLSALPFGLGAADAVLALVLGQLGTSAAVSGAAVLLIRLVATLPLGIAGALSWSVLGRARTATDAPATIAGPG